MKTPFRNVFIAGGNLRVGDDDRVETDLLDSICREVDARAVLCLIGVTGRVDEVTGFGAIVPLSARACDALLVRLIENHTAFGDDAVLSFVISHFISLQAIRADAHVDVSFINNDVCIFRSRNTLRRGFNRDLIRRRALHGSSLRWTTLRGFVCVEWIDVGRVGQRVRDFSIDWIRLLRQREMTDEHQD